MDDLNDVDKWLDEDDTDEETDSESTWPDDNISQYSGGDDDPADE